MLKLKNFCKRVMRTVKSWFEKTILIMQTDPVTTANLKSIFEEIGYKVTVTDFKKFSLIEQYNLILVDNSIDGFLTATRIKMKKPKQKIVMVASTDKLRDEEYVKDEIAVTNIKAALLTAPPSTEQIKKLVSEIKN